MKSVYALLSGASIFFAPALQAADLETKPLAPKPIHIRVKDLPKPFATDSARKRPDVVPIPDKPVLNVPEGFRVDVFAENFDMPRWLTLTPEGDVLVTETRENRIRRIKIPAFGQVATDISLFATAENGLNIPFGMAFDEKNFYLGNTDAVLKFPYKKGQAALEGKGKKIADLPGGGYNQHWTRNVRMAPDGKRLFITVGSKSNAAVEELPRASVFTMNPDGSNRQTVASGLRNPVGLAFHPVTGKAYTTVNERDGLGDDLVPDYFTEVVHGNFYGWPYAYMIPENLDPRRIKNGASENPKLAASTKTPQVLFQAHSAALGVDFSRGGKFPEKYRNGAFAAFRGSWNRDSGTGYKIVFIPFDENNEPRGYYEDFLTGFLIDPSGPTTWGRPVGVLTLPDGSFIFTEEMNGRIYRVYHESQKKTDN